MSLRRRRFQYSLRAFLITTVLFTSVFAAIGNHIHRERQHKAAMYNIAENGGSTLIFNDDTSIVVFRNQPGCWSILNLTDFYSSHSQQVTFSDADLHHLAKINNLMAIDLEGTHVTDKSLDSIARLGDLKILCVANCHLTSSGLAQLQIQRPDLRIVHQDWWHCREVGRLIWKTSSTANGT